MKLLIFVVIFLNLYGTVQAQSDDDAGAVHIIRDWKALEYENTQAPVLRWPQRKFDAPFFCDELIPFRDGYIVNSITTSPGTIDLKTKWYYFDMTTGKLSLLTLPGVDTIGSVIPDKNGGLICAYKAKDRNVIGRFGGQREEDLAAAAPQQVKLGLDTAVWVKLGYRGDVLFACTAHAVYSLSAGRWNQVVINDLAEFFKKRKYDRSFFLLPTRNIMVTDSCIWFLYEVLQGRTCSLLRLDLRTGRITEFFKQLGYTDNYSREINDYALMPDGSLLVCAARLMGNYMVLKTSGEGAEVWTFNNRLRPKGNQDAAGAVAPWVVSEDSSAVGISAVALAGDTIYLAGVNGLFCKVKDRIIPLMRWNNTHQAISEKKYSIDFQFVPRCLQVLPENVFLVGGLWGGLYRVDPSKGAIVCLDDIDYKKIKKVRLGE